MEAPGSSFSAPHKSVLVEPYMILQSLDHPELVITWASEFPDKLKIRKEVTLWPLRFKLRGDYTRALRAFEFGCSCKVSMAGVYGHSAPDLNEHAHKLVFISSHASEDASKLRRTDY